MNKSEYLYWFIVGCEVAFWAFLLLALVARYILKQIPLSRFFLFIVPMADLLLITFTAVDLRAGTPATFAHGLAAAYIGFTVMFGPIIIQWTDQLFAHRFSDGPPTDTTPKLGWTAVRWELRLWFRSVLAWMITLALLTGLMTYVGQESLPKLIQTWFQIAFFSIISWFVLGPMWSMVFFRRGKPAQLDA